MELETAGADTPAADDAVVSPVDTSDATTEQPTPEAVAEPDEQEAGDDAPAAPKRKHWAHDRIDELTRARREAERQAEYWKAKASQSVDPDSLDYEEGIAERVSSRQRKEMAESSANAAQTVAHQIFEARAALVRERFQDYDVVAGNPSLPITASMAEVIMDSEKGPDIAYHLGKNPADAARIAALPAMRQAAELGKLEARLSAPRPVPKQPAPPIAPVGGTASGGSKDPDKMTFAEFKAWREAKS